MVGDYPLHSLRLGAMVSDDITAWWPNHSGRHTDITEANVEERLLEITVSDCSCNN